MLRPAHEAIGFIMREVEVCPAILEMRRGACALTRVQDTGSCNASLRGDYQQRDEGLIRRQYAS